LAGDASIFFPLFESHAIDLYPTKVSCTERLQQTPLPLFRLWGSPLAFVTSIIPLLLSLTPPFRDLYCPGPRSMFLPSRPTHSSAPTKKNQTTQAETVLFSTASHFLPWFPYPQARVLPLFITRRRGSTRVSLFFFLFPNYRRGHILFPFVVIEMAFFS